MSQGARARLAELQGRRPQECAVCGEYHSLSTCGTCGDTLCRDCKIDHVCANEEDAPLGRDPENPALEVE
jgi:hypothetical protein